MLNVASPPCLACDASTSAEYCETSCEHPTAAYCEISCGVPTSAESSQARHWLEIRTMVFWTLRLCIPLLLSWDFGVRPCMHTATSSWTFGSHPHSHSVEHLLEHLHPLFSLFCLSCFVTLGCFVNSLCLPAVGYALVSWAQPLAVLSWVLGSQSLAVLLSSRPFGACFIQPNPMISMPTSPSDSLLLFIHGPAQF